MQTGKKLNGTARHQQVDRRWAHIEKKPKNTKKGDKKKKKKKKKSHPTTRQYAQETTTSDAQKENPQKNTTTPNPKTTLHLQNIKLRREKKKNKKNIKISLRLCRGDLVPRARRATGKAGRCRHMQRI